MHRIDGANHSSNLFTEGPPGTQVTDDWLNDVQETLAQFIEAQGVTLVKGTYTQLTTAVTARLTTLKGAINTWSAAQTFTGGLNSTGVGSGAGAGFTGGTSGGAGAEGVGGTGGANGAFGLRGTGTIGSSTNSSAIGVIGNGASGGATAIEGGHGGVFTGGARGSISIGEDGIGVVGVGGAGVGSYGGKFTGTGGVAGLWARSSATNVNVAKLDGYVDLSGGTQPAATTAFTNQITKKSMAKTWAKITLTAGTAVVTEGLNITSAVRTGTGASSKIVVTTASAFSSADFCPFVLTNNNTYHPGVADTSSTTFEFNIYDIVGAAVLALESASAEFFVGAFGAQ